MWQFKQQQQERPAAHCADAGRLPSICGSLGTLLQARRQSPFGSQPSQQLSQYSSWHAGARAWVVSRPAVSLETVSWPQTGAVIRGTIVRNFPQLLKFATRRVAGGRRLPLAGPHFHYVLPRDQLSPGAGRQAAGLRFLPQVLTACRTNYHDLIQRAQLNTLLQCLPWSFRRS